MDSSTGYSTTPTIDLYNIHLQQQRHPNQLPQQYPQHQQDLPSLHQHQYPDPNEVAASEMIWENQKKHKYILSPPEEHQCTYNQHYPSNMYYNNADKPLNEFYHHRENPNLVKAEDTSLFIDSSLHRQPTITANMHNREDNMSESSSNNTIPSTDSTTRKKVVNNRKQDLKTTEFKKSNRPNVVIEKKRYRRESHNAVERRRRNNINDNIKSLGQLLPDNMREGKLNKGSILKGSVAYIRMLNEQLSKYKERLENLQYEAANMSAISARSSI